jgi:uncharacterized membrane protein YgaE (UPF0421/DUF939 family)
MSDPQSRFALFDNVKLPPYSRAMWIAGIAYAAQVALCSGLLWGAYAQVGASAANWAVVSSVVVLQPGWTQSFQASVFRIAANLLGSLVGLAFGSLLGTGAWQVIAAMMVVVFCCLALRLEQSLRTACVSVIIVMTNSLGSIATTGVQRVIAVFIGSTLAVIVQLLFEAAFRRLREEPAPPKPAARPPSQEE